MPIEPTPDQDRTTYASAWPKQASGLSLFRQVIERAPFCKTQPKGVANWDVIKERLCQSLLADGRWLDYLMHANPNSHIAGNASRLLRKVGNERQRIPAHLHRLHI